METIVNALISTGKKEFSIEFDKKQELLRISTKGHPEKNKANKEIIKKLKKIFGNEIEIISGLKNKEKRIKINLPKTEFKKILQENTN